MFYITFSFDPLNNFMKAIISVIHLLQGRKLGKVKPGSHQVVVAWDSKAGSTVWCSSFRGPCSKAEFRGYILLPHVRPGIGITPLPSSSGLSCHDLFFFLPLLSSHQAAPSYPLAPSCTWKSASTLMGCMGAEPSAFWALKLPAEPGQAGVGRGESEFLLPAVHTGFQTRLIPTKKSRAD